MQPTRSIKLVDIDAAGGIDPRRLARALRLGVKRIERGRYEVSGPHDKLHYVDLIDPAMERCDCADFTWRQTVCQHLLACLVREGDERVVAATARLVAGLLEENRNLRADIRGRTIPITIGVKARVAEAARVHGHDLEFRRDRHGRTSDVTVHHRTSGELLGTLTRSASRAEFVPARPRLESNEQPARAA
jgi:hypothetical protein